MLTNILFSQQSGGSNKCISAQIEPQTFSNRISCGKQFSIDRFRLTVEKETTVEFEYEMGDGSACRHVNQCTPGGVEIQNTQCGGAKAVKCRIHESSKNQKKCGLNIHHIKLQCGKGYTPPSST